MIIKLNHGIIIDLFLRMPYQSGLSNYKKYVFISFKILFIIGLVVSNKKKNNRIQKKMKEGGQDKEKM